MKPGWTLRHPAPHHSLSLSPLLWWAGVKESDPRHKAARAAGLAVSPCWEPRHLESDRRTDLRTASSFATGASRMMCGTSPRRSPSASPSGCRLSTLLTGCPGTRAQSYRVFSVFPQGGHLTSGSQLQDFMSPLQRLCSDAHGLLRLSLLLPGFSGFSLSYYQTTLLTVARIK